MSAPEVRRVLVYVSSGSVERLEKIRAALRARFPEVNPAELQAWQADRGVEQISVNDDAQDPHVEEVRRLVEAVRS